MHIIGIDPGANGGIACMHNGTLIDFLPMPSTRKEVYDVLKKYVDEDVLIVIEKVGVRPGQGISSSGKFMKGYGEILGICTALGFVMEEVTPQAWKKVMLAGTDKSKQASIQRCENLFPSINLILPRCRVPHDGMAEAVLLAAYGSKIH